MHSGGGLGGQLDRQCRAYRRGLLNTKEYVRCTGDGFTMHVRANREDLRREFPMQQHLRLRRDVFNEAKEQCREE